MAKKASCLDNPVDNDVHKKYLQYIIRKVEEASSYLLGLLVRTQFGEDQVQYTGIRSVKVKSKPMNGEKRSNSFLFHSKQCLIPRLLA